MNSIPGAGPTGGSWSALYLLFQFAFVLPCCICVALLNLCCHVVFVLPICICVTNLYLLLCRCVVFVWTDFQMNFLTDFRLNFETDYQKNITVKMFWEKKHFQKRRRKVLTQNLKNKTNTTGPEGSIGGLKWLY